MGIIGVEVEFPNKCVAEIDQEGKKKVSVKRKELRVEPWETSTLNMQSEANESAKQPEKG